MTKTLLTYFSFVLACLIVIVAFISATTYLQLAIAILLYPVLVFFAYKALPSKLLTRAPKQSPAPVQLVAEPPPPPVEPLQSPSFGISDVDKRMFLKLIGGAGLVLFLFSIFSKKGEGLFYKSLPTSGSVSLEDTSGKKIDPAQNQPLDGYIISEMDDDLISFYGFTNNEGLWYVMRIDTQTGSFRYCKGSSDFPGNWGNRQNLHYDYYNKVF